jgi:alpha-L-arabinofuranosidase
MEFRRYSTWLPGYGQELKFVASGPDDANYNWTTGFFEAMARTDPHFRTPWGWASHMHAWNLSRGRTGDWDKGKGMPLTSTQSTGTNCCARARRSRL